MAELTSATRPCYTTIRDSTCRASASVRPAGKGHLSSLLAEMMAPHSGQYFSSCRARQGRYTARWPQWTRRLLRKRGVLWGQAVGLEESGVPHATGRRHGCYSRRCARPRLLSIKAVCMRHHDVMTRAGSKVAVGLRMPRSARKGGRSTPPRDQPTGGRSGPRRALRLRVPLPASGSRRAATRAGRDPQRSDQTVRDRDRRLSQPGPPTWRFSWRFQDFNTPEFR